MRLFSLKNGVKQGRERSLGRISRLAWWRDALRASVVASMFLAGLALAGEEPMASSQIGTAAVEDVVADYPCAAAVMEGVRSALPQQPLKLTGSIQGRNKFGRGEASRDVEFWLEWGGPVPTAVYKVSEPRSRAANYFIVQRPLGEGAVFTHATGSVTGAWRLVKGPEIYQPIVGLDCSWLDLSLDFLWWPDGQVVGTESIKGRDCFIVQLNAPAGIGGDYAMVRLWIDPEYNALLRAECINDKGTVVKRLEIKSFAKIDGFWTVQDMDLQSFPSGHKTVLRMQNVATNVVLDVDRLMAAGPE